MSLVFRDSLLLIWRSDPSGTFSNFNFIKTFGIKNFQIFCLNVQILSQALVKSHNNISSKKSPHKKVRSLPLNQHYSEREDCPSGITIAVKIAIFNGNICFLFILDFTIRAKSYTKIDFQGRCWKVRFYFQDKSKYIQVMDPL